MALSNIIDQISESLDVKNIPLAFLFSFESIWYHWPCILLEKLQVYGIRGCALKWFYSYLADRSQCVCIDDVCSTSFQLNYVIPRDPYLILCYLLYILMILIVKSSHLLQFIMFANDSNLFATHFILDELLKIVNQEIEKNSNWLKINQLSLNIEKKIIIESKNPNKFGSNWTSLFHWFCGCYNHWKFNLVSPYICYNN